MKKLPLLAAAVFIASAAYAPAQAQFVLDFDDLEAGGGAAEQSPHIVRWPLSFSFLPSDAQITDERAVSPPNSLVVSENVGRNDENDVLVNLGNQSEGVWSIEWMTYVPEGASGFWNIQYHELAQEAGFGVQYGQWNGQFFIGLPTGDRSLGGLTGYVTLYEDPVEVGNLRAPFPYDDWYKTVVTIDFRTSDDPDNEEGLFEYPTISVWIDGRPLLDRFPYFTLVTEPDGTQYFDYAYQLGAINFYSLGLNNRFYIDDFQLAEGTLPPGDSVTPDPEEDDDGDAEEGAAPPSTTEA